MDEIEGFTYPTIDYMAQNPKASARVLGDTLSQDEMQDLGDKFAASHGDDTDVFFGGITSASESPVTNVYPDGRIRVWLWADSTFYELGHEGAHVIHARSVGNNIWDELHKVVEVNSIKTDPGKVIRELYVYEQLHNELVISGHKIILSSAEDAHSRNLIVYYIEEAKVTEHQVIDYLHKFQKKYDIDLGVSDELIREAFTWKRTDLDD